MAASKNFGWTISLRVKKINWLSLAILCFDTCCQVNMDNIYSILLYFVVQCPCVVLLCFLEHLRELLNWHTSNVFSLSVNAAFKGAQGKTRPITYTSFYLICLKFFFFFLHKLNLQDFTKVLAKRLLYTTNYHILNWLSNLVLVFAYMLRWKPEVKPNHARCLVSFSLGHCLTLLLL